MGQIDLKPTLFCLGPATEDLENEAGTVQNLDLPFPLEIALLNRRQLCVNDGQTRLTRFNPCANFLNLARRQQCGRRHL